MTTPSAKELTDNCLIFISRRHADGEIIDSDLEDQMSQLAAGRLSLFSPEQVQGAEDERQRVIREKLSSANLLFLVLPKTPSSTEFDWPLWNAGFFKGVHDDDGSRSVCFIPVGGEVPEQIARHVQKVEVTVDNLKKIFYRLFAKKEFTHTKAALNPTVTEDMVEPLAQQAYDQFIKAQEEHVEYGNPWIKLLLPPGASGVEDATRLKSDAQSLKTLFDLPEAKRESPSGLWTWADLGPKVSHVSPDPGKFNRVWMVQLAEEVATKLKGDETVEQLTSRYLSHDKELYRPEIEEWRTTGEGLAVLVTFSLQVQDSWLKSATSPVALAANISLASRIRHELIEPFRKAARKWTGQESIKTGLAKMEELAAVVERHGFFIGCLTQSKLEDAFVESDEQYKELHRLWDEYGTKIKPRMKDAIAATDLEEIKTVLDLWDDNNLDFLNLAISRYQGMIRQVERS
jgi:hypothetical protein